MNNHHVIFIDAIHNRKKLSIKFYSEDDGGYIVRTCAPMDHAVGRKIADRIPRYWFWDLESDEKNHTLPLKLEKIASMIPTGDLFDPGDFITWKPNWVIPRDWGQYS